jgi:hypothetical protein
VFGATRIRRIVHLALATTALAATPARAFEVQGLFQFGPRHIGVAYSDSVNATLAVEIARYTLTPQGGAPAITLQSASLQDNHRTVILVAAAPLPASAAYQVAVSGVTSNDGDPLTPGGPTGFTTVAETVLGIDEVHANIGTLDGQIITVIGQVFLTASSGGSTPSAYVQDGTGRGLNLFGGTLQPVTDQLGSVVKATGTADLFFTTVEVTAFAATQLAAGQPHLAPKVLTVAQASSAQWEGTYIATTATLTGPGVASGSNNYNYPASDGSTPFIFRVRNATGLNPAPVGAGDVVTAAGAGAVFQTTYQVLVGNAADFQVGGTGGDTTPPTLVSASGQGGSTQLAVTFSEPVVGGASTAGNYTVYPTASPGSPIAVAGASAAGAVVTLALASPLTAATPYTVAVSNVADVAGNLVVAGSTVGFTATAASFEVRGVFQFGADYVGVAFSDRVNGAQAIQIANYSFSPPLALAAATVQENGQTAILEIASPLPPSTTYQLTVGGITSATGGPLSSAGPFSMQTVAGTVVDIADIHADLAGYTGQNVTVVGQVYIPVGSRGGTPSGYIQDGSGRGLNLFGGSIQAPANALGNVVRVSGLVELFFTTAEITGYSATAIATGQPHLGPRILTAAQANSSQWEGTYIQTSATLTAITASGASNYNYDATDGGSNITFRVGNGLGIPPSSFAIGDRVTGRGAGGAFQTTFQINVGNAQDFFKSTGPDVEPPRLGAASGIAGSSTLTLTFSEPVQAAEATQASNYRVYPVASPGSPIAVTGVTQAAGGAAVTLSLAAALAATTSYAVEVSNVRDLAGNVILPASTVTFTPAPAPPTAAAISVPPVTLVRNLTGVGEVFPITITAVLDTRVTCRIFDLQGRLVKVLFDGRLTGTPSRNLTWDARDETFEFVPAGLYVCHVQATDGAGNITHDRAPIVVAVRLE